MSLSPLTLVGIILFTAIVAGGLTAFWLRSRGVDVGDRVQPREHTPEQEQAPVHAQQTFVGPDFRPVKLTFRASREASPVMEISALKASAVPRNKHRLEPSGTALTTFSPFLQLIPHTLTGAECGRYDYIQVLVHGPLALASEPQSFLPFVCGVHGEVEELLRLTDSDQLQQVISSGMGWQLAFLVVAWKHLADINEKLDYIKSGFEEIKKFLINERRSKIAGTLDYLRQVVKTLGRKESPAALRNQVEHIERELLQFQNHIMRDLGTSAEKIGAIIQSRFKSRKTRANTIHERADEMLELEREWLLCILARTVNWQVLSVFPGDKQFKIARKGSLYKSIDEFTGFLQHVYRQLHEKISTVKSPLDSISASQQDKSLLVQFDIKRRLLVDNNQISSDALAIRGEVRKFASQLWSPQKPIVLAIKLDQRRIVEAYEIEHSDTNPTASLVTDR